MSQHIERDDATSIFDPDPILGKYVSHHPSNRLRLMLIAGVLYALPVGALQLIFWNVDDQTAAIFLPIIYATIAGACIWFMLHHWNREVVLYERGFSFRQGSSVAFILYANVLKLTQRIEKISFLGFSRTVYDYTLVTDVDETLKINNVYSNPEKLTRILEGSIARDRQVIMRDKIRTGEGAGFGDDLKLLREGIVYQDRELVWHEFKQHRVKDGQFIIQSKDNDEWAVIPVMEINNPVLFIAMLKERGKIPEATR